MGKKSKKVKEEKEEKKEEAQDEDQGVVEEKGKLKPVVKGKVKKRIAKEVVKEEEEVGKEEVDEELDVDDDLYKSVWVGWPEGMEVDLEMVQKVMQTVGEVKRTSKISESTAQITFSSIGSVRQALLLHNKSISQLPSVSLTTPRPTPDPSHRISVDLPLDESHRVYIGNLPNHCDNREVAKALRHFGNVAYVYRNAFKSYGFAAFKAKSAVDKAVKAEAVVVRGKQITIKEYKKSTERRWQESQTTEALAYLNTLVPLNPYVVSAVAEPSPVSAQTPDRRPQASPFSLTPLTPPTLTAEKPTKKRKAASEGDEGVDKKKKKKKKKEKQG